MTCLLAQKRVRVASATLLTAIAALLLPLLVHLLPASGGAPLGARLLPIFYAPFLAAMLFRPAVSLGAAALTPLLNHLLTGRPPLEMVGTLTAELLIFVGLVLVARRYWPKGAVIAPLAYVVTHLLLFAAFALDAPTSASALLGSLWTALPGIAVLFALNLLVTRSWDRNPR